VFGRVVKNKWMPGGVKPWDWAGEEGEVLVGAERKDGVVKVQIKDIWGDDRIALVMQFRGDTMQIRTECEKGGVLPAVNYRRFQ